MKILHFWSHGNIKADRVPANNLEQLLRILRPSSIEIIEAYPYVFIRQENNKVNQALRLTRLAQTITGNVCCFHADGDDFDLDDVLQEVNFGLEFYSPQTRKCHRNENALIPNRPGSAMHFKIQEPRE